MVANINMGGEPISPRAKAAQTAADAKQKADQQAGLQKYANIAISDLNSGDYAGALQAGLDSGKLYSTNYGTTTTDPLLEALESSQGLQELDPSKKWDADSIQKYYAAFGANNVTQGKQAGTANAGESWGKNPYGLWGDPSKIAGADAAANISTQGDNSAPDIERFAGSRPTKSFMGKYGVDIAALAATVLSFGVAAPALAGALAADGIATGLAAGAIAGGVMGGVNTLAIDAITGKPITAGGVLGGALGGAAGGGLTGLASGAINDATGLGTTVSGGLAGAGIGAGRAALTGGNVGMGALAGGIGGAVQGSGALGNIKTGLTGAGVPAGLAGAAVNGGANYAIGGATGLAAGALMNNGGVQQGGQMRSGAAPSNGSANYLGAGALGVGGILSQGAQGNNGNMGITSSTNNAGSSTDSTLASTITGALPGVLQAGAGVYGAQNAAQAQQTADNSAINTQKSAMGNINSIWSGQKGTGDAANAALTKTMTGGPGGTPDYSGFENMPGYQFAVSQGTQAIQRQAASMGNAYTPNTAQAVGQYVTGTAMQDYNTYISQLMNAAGLGSTANTGLQTGTQNTSDNISQLQQNIGQAQVSGVKGASTAVGGIFGANGVGTSLIGAAGRYLGGGSGGGGSGGGGGGNTASGVGGQAGTMPYGGDVNGGVNPSTGVPYDLSPGGQPVSDGGMFDPNNTSFGGATYDPNWNSLTGDDTNIFGGGGTDFLNFGGGADNSDFTNIFGG